MWKSLVRKLFVLLLIGIVLHRKKRYNDWVVQLIIIIIVGWGRGGVGEPVLLEGLGISLLETVFPDIRYLTGSIHLELHC